MTCVELAVQVVKVKILYVCKETGLPLCLNPLVIARSYAHAEMTPSLPWESNSISTNLAPYLVNICQLGFDIHCLLSNDILFYEKVEGMDI